jgi:hypothetical protein
MITDEMETITFTPDKLAELKDAYAKSRALGLNQFEFQGHTLLVNYAKYLIEYLDDQFTNPKAEQTWP